MIGLIYGSLIYVKGEQQKVFAELTANDSTFSIEKPLSEADSLREIVKMKENELTQKEIKIDSIKNDVSKQVEVAKLETV